MTTTLCPHVLDVEVSFHQKCIQALLKNTKKLTCPETGCSHGLPGLWACLGPNCTYIGCGRNQNKHLLAHYNWSKKSREEHCVCINLSTRMIWCYACDNEIIDSDYAKDDAAFIENLREVLTSTAPAPRPSTGLTVSSSSSHARGACGLANLGNTCYANAALQSLAHCPPLRSYFLQYMARQVQGKKKTSHLVFHFTQLLYDLWGGQLSSLRPTDVLREVRRFNPMFGGYAQQDSQEFMRCLLDRLHEDTKEELPRPLDASPSSSSSSLSLSSSGEKEKETKPAGGGEPASSNNGLTPAVDLSMVRPTPPPPPSYASVVSRLFQGFLLSRIKCLKCGKVSPTKDAFYDLSIPIPDDKMLDKVTREGEADGVPYNSKRPSGGFFSKLGNWLMLSNRTVTLEDCLQAFCTKEELMGADRYRCEHCKTLNDSQKFLRIAQPPEVLCIHIKRFRHDSYFGGKLNDVVQFPLRDLDISRFCEQAADGPQQPPLKYDLVAVVNHIGGLSGGHYIAYALNDLDGKWYEFDDSWATPVSEETVKNKEAYVLLYQRRMPTERELERKRLQAVIAAFHEDEELRRAAALSDPPEASPDNDSMHVDKNGVIELPKKYFVCQEWITRWKCTTHPGPIYNAKYLCSHGLVRPQFSTTQAVINRNFETVPEEVWARFMQQYGGGPAVCESQFGECQDCKIEAEQLRARRKEESKKINEIDRTYVTAGEMWYLISAKWLQHWADFSRGKAAAPPGPIDNWSLLLPNGNPKPKLKCSTHYRGLVREVWEYFHSRYGGGPVLMRPVIDIYAGTSGGRSRSSSLVSSAARPIRSSSSSLSASRPLSPVASPSTSATSPTSPSGLASSSSPRSPSSPYASFTSNRQPGRSPNSNGTTTASPSTSPTGSSSSASTLSSSAKRAAYYKNLNIAQNGTHGERRQPSQSPQQQQQRQQNARAKAPLKQATGEASAEHADGHDDDEVEMDELARPTGQSKTASHRQRDHHHLHHPHDYGNGNEEDEEDENGTNGVGRGRKGGPSARRDVTTPASPSSSSSHLDRMLEDD